MLDFTKRKPIKCLHCGKPREHHLAGTLHCPQGVPHRTVGYTSYHSLHRFIAPTPTQEPTP